LHGVKYEHGILSLILDDFEIRNNQLVILNRCQALTDDLTCRYHGTKHQPKVCSYPNPTCNKGEGFIVTPNCVFREVKYGMDNR
jgi:hypothetical protein